MPRKRKTSSSTSTSEGCAVCGGPCFGGSPFCGVHGLVSYAVELAERGFKKGRPTDAILGSLAAVVLQSGGPTLQRLADGIGAPGPTAAGPPDPRQREVARTRAAFVLLGLDPKKATVADVREVQRKLAAIYHPDTSSKATASSKMSEINAAAEMCIKVLQRTQF